MSYYDYLLPPDSFPSRHAAGKHPSPLYLFLLFLAVISSTSVTICCQYIDKEPEPEPVSWQKSILSFPFIFFCRSINRPFYRLSIQQSYLPTCIQIKCDLKSGVSLDFGQINKRLKNPIRLIYYSGDEVGGASVTFSFVKCVGNTT